MRRIIAFIVALVCFVSSFALAEEMVAGCEITLHLPYGDRTGIYTGEIKDGIPHGYGCFETQNLSGVTWIYAGYFVNGVFDGEGQTIWGTTRYEYGKYDDGLLAEGAVQNNEHLYIGVFDNADELTGEGTIYNEFGDVSHVGTFEYGKPVERVVVDSDFYNSIHDVVECYQFDAAKELLTAYASQNPNLPINQNYEILLRLVEESSLLMAKCNAEYDAIEEHPIVTYKGLEQIGEKTHLYTFIDGSTVITYLGFVSDDWLFFDNIIIVGDGMNKISFSVSDTVRDIIDGGMIMERYEKRSWYDKDIEALNNGSNMVMRFKNEDTNEYIDLNISDPEIDAWRTLHRLQDIRRDILNLCYQATKTS